MALPVARTAAMASLWPGVWLVALGLEFAVGGLATWLAGQHGPALLGTAANLLVAWRFAATLRPGAVPLITRYARHDPAGLPPRAERYTRRLTAAWAILLGLFALAHAAATAGLWPLPAVSLTEAVLCTAGFLAEHLLRSRLFPELGRATPWRTFGAIRAAGARHAG
ncbi:hypothetical protein QWZ14_28755 [Paeniroseomonas aquatica]|uniref:Uncharacterized protein n=1 Tax=Paeniroseomonas aquatica TaxID=373043 RepID=A0ABT8AF32_9PROT|nr:hypothetical protein [Paeniroseomonas aquatica]MDN3568389.1 hypothetical protein [Paeniroseomonas aquatica]